MPIVDLTPAASSPAADPAASAESAVGTSPGLTGYLARPTTPGPWPGVVVLQEAWGVDDVLRRQCDHLASLGYLALAPDLYSDGGGLRCVRAVFAAMTSGSGRAFADIEAARQWLLADPGCTGKVGVIGFCMGGGFVLVVAGRGGYDVASANYGQLPSHPDLLRGACPVVASYGGKDRSLRGAAAKLDHALDRLGVEHDVREYPDAGHSFLADAPNGPAPLRPLMKIMGAGPEPARAVPAARTGRLVRKTRR